MDTLSFVSPSNIRALIVPANKISRSEFEDYSVLLRRVKDVRAVDLIHNPGIFNPQAYPQGHILFTFITQDGDSDSLFLHNFEPFRKTAVVVGIAKWTPQLNDKNLKDLIKELKKQYSNPISHCIMVFSTPSDFTTKVEDVHLVNMENSNMETKICDMTSKFLNNFSTYASAYQHMTLRSPGNITGHKVLKPATTLIEKQKRRITGSFELNQEQLNQMMTKGRKQKLSANFFLLAGNFKGGLSDFCEAIFNLKSTNDYLWLASAFDGLAVCIFMLSFIGAPFQLPLFLSTMLDNVKESDLSSSFLSPGTSPRPSFQLSSNSTPRASTMSMSLQQVPLNTVQELIFKICKLSSYYYKITKEVGEDDVPQIVYSESVLRYASLLVSIGIEGSFNSNVLNNALYYSPLSNDKITEDASFDYENFNLLCSCVFNSEFKNISESQKLRIYDTMIDLYSKTNMDRKRSLLIKNLIDITISSKTLTKTTKFVSEKLDELLDSYCYNYGIRTNLLTSKIHSGNSLQKATLQQIVTFCNKIKYHSGCVKYGSILLRDLHSLMTDEEQLTIYTNISEKMSLYDLKGDYWDSELFQDFEFYGQQKIQLVQEDLCDAIITIRNPFAFEIELNDLEISTLDNFPLKTHINSKRQSLEAVQNKISTVVKPKSHLSIPLFVAPLSHGKLRINGLKASVCSCEPQLFILEEGQFQQIKHKQINAKDAIKEGIYKNPIARIWEADVIYEQPLLKLVDVKLNDRWIMLLEGECKQFQIVLKNSSKVEINQLVSKFLDSTIEPLHHLLGNKSLPPNEVYEIEYYLLKKKPFKILNKNDMTKILGNSEFHLEIEIWGKRGVKEASLILEYSHQQAHAQICSPRSVTIPVNVTVYPSIELAGCDIIPLSLNTKVNNVNKGNQDSCWAFLENMCSKGFKMSNFCLLALDFVNAWTEEMELSIQSLLKGSVDPDFQESNGLMKSLPENSFHCTTLLHSKKNVRLFIPIKRMDFDDEFLNRRIPSLRNKQFILDTKTSEAEQTFINHAFWYRDELLKRVRACWKIPNTVNNSVYAGRSGTIDLRSLRFSSKMVDILEVEKIEISLKLLTEVGTQEDLDNVQLNTFYTVKLKLINRNKYPIFGMLRHIPVCKSPPFLLDKKILFNGVLQSSIGNQLLEGEQREFDLGIVFLEKGEYEWGALFDEMSGFDTGNLGIRKQHIQREQLKIMVC